MDFQELVQHRQHLHQNPEVAFCEIETRKYLRNVILQQPIVACWDVGETGLLVQVCGQEKAAGMLFRTDIDALPIQEANEDLAYRSKNDGVAHLCGHDGHAAIALGLIMVISKKPCAKPLYVIFQPAEETGMGALQVLESKLFQEISFTKALALHNLPGFAKAKVLLSKATFSASVCTLFLKLQGKYSHAAEPYHGVNPALAIAKIVQKLEQMNDFSTEDSFQFGTVVCIKVGERAYGTNPGNGELHITLRAAQHEAFVEFKEKLLQESATLAKEENLNFDYEELEFFPSVKQNPTLLEKTEEVLVSHKLDYSFLDGPNKWGEDFGFFGNKMPLLMVGIGSGENQAPLHNVQYNFPDEIIEPTVQFLINTIEKNNV